MPTLSPAWPWSSSFAEHLDAGAGGLLRRRDADDLDFLADLDDAALDPAGDDGAATGDGEDVFDGHQERAVDGALGLGDVGVEGLGELHDGAFAELALVAFQGELGRAVDDRGGVAGELVLVEQLAHFHLDELEQLGVVDHVALVHVDDDVRNAHLAGQQDVLTRLRHGAVGGGHDQDGAVHLRRTGDHVLDVVGVPGAVDVGVVPVLGLVLDVGGVDGDAARLLFGRRVDLVVRLGLAAEQLAQHRRDRRRQASSCRGPRDQSSPRSRAAWSARICSLPFLNSDKARSAPTPSRGR